MQGYVKDYRKELNSDVWKMPPLYHRVWQYLKYMANHTDKKVPMQDGSIVTVSKGQLITSYQKIAEDVQWTEWGVPRIPNKKTVKAVLDWLEKQEMITRNSNAKGTAINICNYCVYQGEDTEKVTLKKRGPDTNKNDKNDKNKKTLLQIENLRSRYSKEQLKTIDEYLGIVRWTRKNGVIADTVILKMYQEWDKHTPNKVIYGLRVYIDNPKHHDKRENYVYGIIRNANAEQVAGEVPSKQSRGHPEGFEVIR